MRVTQRDLDQSPFLGAIQACAACRQIESLNGIRRCRGFVCDRDRACQTTEQHQQNDAASCISQFGYRSKDSEVIRQGMEKRHHANADASDSQLDAGIGYQFAIKLSVENELESASLTPQNHGGEPDLILGANQA